MRKRTRKVSFKETPKVPKKVNVSFISHEGKRVSFVTTKKVPKRVHLRFRSRRKSLSKAKRGES